MLRGVKDRFSDRIFITDLTAKLVITFGAVLIIGGLYLMITDPGASTQAAQTRLAVETVVSTLNWVPGIPFYIGDLANSSASAIGLVSWFIGLDLLLVGLGLWARHRLARFAALMIFTLAACFQFIQFLQFGILGAPASVVEFCIDGIFVYFLSSKFDSQTGLKTQLAS